MTDPVRHDLLRLTASGWAGAPDELGHWAARDLPVMRRRAQPGDDPGLVPVAVARPGGLRCAFGVRPAAIAAVARPPTLAEAMAGLPDRFRDRAGAVLELAADLAPRVFGSAMWQHLTGLPYLHERSDLDLLWDLPASPDPAPLIARLVAALRTLERSPGPRLDGEIVLDRARAVNWRELAPGAAGEILVKTDSAVTLMSRARFLSPAALPC